MSACCVQVGKFLQLMATFIGGFVIAFAKGWMLALVMLAAIPLLVLAGATVSILVSRMATRGQNAYAEAATVVEQTIGSIRTVGYVNKRMFEKYKNLSFNELFLICHLFLLEV